MTSCLPGVGGIVSASEAFWTWFVTLPVWIQVVLTTALVAVVYWQYRRADHLEPMPPAWKLPPMGFGGDGGE